MLLLWEVQTDTDENPGVGTYWLVVGGFGGAEVRCVPCSEMQQTKSWPSCLFLAAPWLILGKGP